MREALIQDLDAITATLREKGAYEIERISFGSAVRTERNTNKPLREAHDVDYRIRVADAATAERAAMDYKRTLENHGIGNVEYGVSKTYGDCPRLAYEVQVGKSVIPVEIFFENKADKTGMFGGLDTSDIRHRRAEGLDRVSRAQDVRTLLVSLLRESEVGGGKGAQRMDDLRALYSQYTARALERAKQNGTLYDWLSAGNPQLKALIERNKGTLDTILDDLSRTTNDA